MKVSRNTAIILILAAVILIIGVLLYFYLSPGTTTNTPITNTETPVTQSPFGNNNSTEREITNTNTNTSNTSTTTNVISEDKVNTLRKIFSEPVSGTVMITKNKESFVRFVERSNGNVLEAGKSSPQVVRLTNTTIPKIQEVIFDQTGNYPLYRYLDTDKNIIQSFLGRIKLATSTSNDFYGEVLGSFLPTNITGVSSSPTGSKFAYTLPQTGGGSTIFVTGTEVNTKRSVYSSQLSEIAISWTKDNSIMMLTKPTYKYAGFLYEINILNGVSTKLLGNIWGLNVLVNPVNSKILYSKISRRLPQLMTYNPKTGEEVNLEIQTLVDKCVWSKTDPNVAFCAIPNAIIAGDYPDSWYLGKTTFFDSIWKIDIESKANTLVNSLEVGGIDAVDLKLSSNDDFLTFTNKNDLSLWGLILK